MTNNKFNLIAIDGELATGKTTISRMIAAQNNYILLSTGVLFRAIGYLIFEEPVIRGSLHIEDKPGFELEVDWDAFFKDFKVNKIAYLDYLNRSWIAEKFGVEVGEKRIVKCCWKNFHWDLPAHLLTDEKASGRYAGILAKVMPIRDWIKRYCHTIIEDFIDDKIGDSEWQSFHIQGAIMEGRDICWNMLPEANLKFYLTCDLAAKKERRVLDFEIQNHRKPTDAEAHEMFTALERRVKSDELILAPSKNLPGVIKIDTSKLTIMGELAMIQGYIDQQAEA